MDLSVIIPVYNSENIIENLIEKTINEIKNIDKINSFEIYLVNDFSQDNSWDKIKLLSKKFPSVKGVDLSENFGQHNATMCGLNECKGDFIVVMDDDLQHPPHYIKDLIKKLEEGYDACYTNYLNRKHSMWKMAVSWLNNIVSSFLLNKPFHMYLSSFKGLKKKIAKEIILFKKNNVYLDGLILKATRNIAMISVPHSQRPLGVSNYNFKKLIILWSSMALNFPIFPLRPSTFFGFFVKFFIIITQKMLLIENKSHKPQYFISKKTYID